MTTTDTLRVWRAWATSPEGTAALDRALVDAVARLARDLRHEPPHRFADRIPAMPASATPTR